MGTITTLRPSATSSGVGWTAQPSGTLHGVTSDDSDATYAEWSGDGSALILATPLDSPPAGERRHQVRLRARGEDGDAWWAVRLASGSLVAGAAGQFTASPSTITGSWGFGAPADGGTVLSTYVTGQSSGVRIQELYLDVDTREAPSFTPQVLDGTSSSVVSVSDTATPTLHVEALDLDGLAGRQYRYWVTLDSDSSIVWDTGVVSGPPSDQTASPLANDAYTAHFQVWSTLGSATAYASDEETLSFTMTVGEIPSPVNPTVTPVPDTPFYDVEACAPYVADLDGGVAYVEIQRVDCPDGDATARTIAVLGPLATDECDIWRDFTHPRTGMGLTCDHDPEPCCSFYRARTIGRIDGNRVISPWSDTYDPGIPSGITVMWPSTDASVPSGWSRVTDLDGRYVKGVPDDSTQPGATGGSATHTHTVPNHVHNMNHSHAVGGNTSSAVGSVLSNDGAPGTTAISSNHTHTFPANTNERAVNSGTATPGTNSVSNEVDRLEVIFMESDGTPLGVPDGALGLAPDISPSGWTDLATSGSPFLKGAPTAGDGGTESASDLDAHTHAVDAHTHTGTSHGHTMAQTGSTSSNLSLFSGPNSVVWSTSHYHLPTIADTSTAGLQLSTAGSSNGTDPDLPPYRNLKAIRNDNGAPDLPVGLIGIWRGSLGSVPLNWQLCDGTNGTVDLLGRYPRIDPADIGVAGGSLNPHSHTTPNHSHAITAHSHSITTGPPLGNTTNTSATAVVSVATATHTHTGVTQNDSTANAGNAGVLGETTTEPVHAEVAFVQLVEEPTPPPDPTRFCLTWSDDTHLIRTTGPDGPMWAPVGGMFSWDVDRPFTAATGVNGTRFVTSAPPGARNLQMTAAVESEEELATLKAILDRPLVLISPSDASEVWAAPVSTSVRVVKVGRIREVTASFIGTGPEPEPQLQDVGQ